MGGRRPRRFVSTEHHDSPLQRCTKRKAPLRDQQALGPRVSRRELAAGEPTKGREVPNSGTFFGHTRFPCEARTGGTFEMDWNRVEGNWKQVKGKVKEKWGQLTEDDLDVIAGRRDQLEGKIQERYGLAKDQVRKDIDDWYATQRW